MLNRLIGACVAAFALVGPGTHVAALTYSAKPIRAQVVDAETKQPIPEVIILVVWELENARGGWGGFFHWEETVSDANGMFEFAGWGPNEVPRSSDGRALRMSTDQPNLHLYKPGYQFGLANNFLETWMLGDPHWTGDPVRSSSASGTQIQLERFRGTDVQYRRSLGTISGTFPLQRCRWARIPRLTAALIMAGRSAPPHARGGLPTLEQLAQDGAEVPGCPGIAVLERYLK